MTKVTASGTEKKRLKCNQFQSAQMLTAWLARKLETLHRRHPERLSEAKQPLQPLSRMTLDQVYDKLVRQIQLMGSDKNTFWPKKQRLKSRLNRHEPQRKHQLLAEKALNPAGHNYFLLVFMNKTVHHISIGADLQTAGISPYKVTIIGPRTASALKLERNNRGH